MASRELSRAAYDHETGTKDGIDVTKEFTTYNPWGVGHDGAAISVFAIGDMERDGVTKNIRVSMGFLSEGLTRDQAAKLVTQTTFTAVKVMGINETIRFTPTQNVDTLRRLSGLRTGVITALGPVCCPKAYVYPVGKELKVRFVHLIYTMLPTKVKSHKTGGGIRLKKTKIVGGVHVTIETQGRTGKITLPLSIPFMEWREGYDDVFPLLGKVMECSLKVALGGVNGLSIHITAVGHIHKDLKGTGIAKNMVLCPMFTYPDIVFSNCLKSWKITSARLILQQQPRIFHKVNDPLMSEKEMVYKALKSGGDEEED